MIYWLWLSVMINKLQRNQRYYMQISPTKIPDVVVITPEIYEDHRGLFLEIFRESEYAKAGIEAFVQDNLSISRQGVLRGLHYQIQQAQGKLVQVVRGRIFDVAVDLRTTSPSFGQYVGVFLDDDQRQQLWIPPGFAHGFYVLSKRAIVLYKATSYFAPQWERTLAWDDPELGIDWPILSEDDPILSGGDARGFPLADAEVYE